VQTDGWINTRKSWLSFDTINYMIKKEEG